MKNKYSIPFYYNKILFYTYLKFIINYLKLIDKKSDKI